MADEIDIANGLMEGEIDYALKRIRQNAPKNTAGTKFCIECGESIPEGRQNLGFKLCVPCAEEGERKKSLFADHY